MYADLVRAGSVAENERFSAATVRGQTLGISHPTSPTERVPRQEPAGRALGSNFGDSGYPAIELQAFCTMLVISAEQDI